MESIFINYISINSLPTVYAIQALCVDDGLPEEQNSCQDGQCSSSASVAPGTCTSTSQGTYVPTHNGEERIWSAVESDVHVNPFTANVGPTVTVSENLALFETFFTHEMVQEIVRQTNLYAKQCMQVDDCEEMQSHWETTEEEIRAYLGFTILMGITRQPDLYDYWSTNPVLHYFPIASRISRTRFLEIKRFLHFVDNTTLTLPLHDKLAKVRPMLECIRERCIQNYTPHRENSVDEAMIRFKGRSSLKQYMPMKPIERGIKVWVRADSHNGYVCDFHVYCGKEGNNVTTNLGARVVTDLCQPLHHKNYHVYYDNFFTSVDLQESLLKDGVYSCGTYRKDRRGIPPELKNTKLGATYMYSTCSINT